jgi:hypothetical protein
VENDPKKLLNEFLKPDMKRPDVTAKPGERFQKLLNARHEMAVEEWRMRSVLYKAGGNEPGNSNPLTLQLVLDAAKHLLKAELELSNKKAERLEAREAHLKRMKEIVDITERRYKASLVLKPAFASALYEQLDAEIELEREKAQ